MNWWWEKIKVNKNTQKPVSESRTDIFGIGIELGRTTLTPLWVEHLEDRWPWQENDAKRKEASRHVQVRFELCCL